MDGPDACFVQRVGKRERALTEPVTPVNAYRGYGVYAVECCKM